ncbi:SAV_6107 family HEPN domain-containing protein [Virgisporangium aurantiacum]|uniref:SAV_6107 family HEPN domain-containing protein n=1 Tax=Virgisporangium aurantiacum TaxID=175570 RepID=UPI00194FE426
MATRRSSAPLSAVPADSPAQSPFPAGGPAVPPGAAPIAPIRQELPVPAHALPQRTPRELLTMARRGLEEAATMRPDGLRYATAHLAALRAAAAVLAARAIPSPGVRRSRPTSVWTLVVMVAPELRDWAAFFAAGAAKRAAAEAGIPRVVTAREADDLMRSAEQFIAVVEVGLGFAYQPILEGLAS